MTIQRLTLAQVKTEIFRIMGVTSSTNAPWGSDANLFVVVNAYGQRLPIHVAQIARESAPTGNIRFDMYRTVATSATSGTGLIATSGSQTVYLPLDYDETISWWDLTNDVQIDQIRDVARFHPDLKNQAAGPPNGIEMLDFVTDGSSNWRRQAKLHPATETGVTPSLELTYYRLPAIMPGDTPTVEYIDADPKYQMLWVYGPALELMRPNHPSYERYLGLEKELLIDLAQTGARAIE